MLYSFFRFFLFLGLFIQICALSAISVYAGNLHDGEIPDCNDELNTTSLGKVMNGVMKFDKAIDEIPMAADTMLEEYELDGLKDPESSFVIVPGGEFFRSQVELTELNKKLNAIGVRPIKEWSELTRGIHSNLSPVEMLSLLPMVFLKIPAEKLNEVKLLFGKDSKVFKFYEFTAQLRSDERDKDVRNIESLFNSKKLEARKNHAQKVKDLLKSQKGVLGIREHIPQRLFVIVDNEQTRSDLVTLLSTQNLVRSEDSPWSLAIEDDLVSKNEIFISTRDEESDVVKNLLIERVLTSYLSLSGIRQIKVEVNKSITVIVNKQSVKRRVEDSLKLENHFNGQKLEFLELPVFVTVDSAAEQDLAISDREEDFLSNLVLMRTSASEILSQKQRE